MDYTKLADLLYPNTTKTIQDYLNIYQNVWFLRKDMV